MLHTSDQDQRVLQSIIQQSLPKDDISTFHINNFRDAVKKSNDAEKQDVKPKKEKKKLEPSKKQPKVASEVPKPLIIDTILKKNRTMRYFMMKVSGRTNFELAIKHRIWATLLRNESKLNDAYKQGEVILIFSINESGHFQAFARMVSPIGEETSPIWENNGHSKIGGVFKLDWLCVKELPFKFTQHLKNEFNEDKPVKIGRDGQEISPDVGFEICKLIEYSDNFRIHNDKIESGKPSPKQESKSRSDNEDADQTCFIEMSYEEYLKKQLENQVEKKKRRSSSPRNIRPSDSNYHSRLLKSPLSEKKHIHRDRPYHQRSEPLPYREYNNYQRQNYYINPSVSFMTQDHKDYMSWYNKQQNYYNGSHSSRSPSNNEFDKWDRKDYNNNQYRRNSRRY